jgi:hypothetical protein
MAGPTIGNAKTTHPISKLRFQKGTAGTFIFLSNGRVTDRDSAYNAPFQNYKKD